VFNVLLVFLNLDLVVLLPTELVLHVLRVYPDLIERLHVKAPLTPSVRHALAQLVMRVTRSLVIPCPVPVLPHHEPMVLLATMVYFVPKLILVD